MRVQARGPERPGQLLQRHPLPVLQLLHQPLKLGLVRGAGLERTIELHGKDGRRRPDQRGERLPGCPAPDHQLEMIRAARWGARSWTLGCPGRWRRSSAVQREPAGQQLIKAPVVSKMAHWPPAAAATSASTAPSDPPDRAAFAQESASSHDCRVRANRSASRTLVTKRCSCRAGTTLGTSSRGIPWALAASTNGLGISRCATPVTKAMAQTGTPASRST